MSTPPTTTIPGKRAPLALPRSMRVGWQLAPYLCMALPVAACWLYVATFGRNVVWGDSWALVPTLEHWENGTLTLAEFWRQHNEHRWIVAKFVEFFLAIATNWNTWAELIVIQACLLVILLTHLAAFFWEMPVRTRTWWAIPIAWCIMSPAQVENLLWGFQVGFLFAAMFAVLSFLLLHWMRWERRPWAKFAAASVAAALATFSHGPGLMVWPAGILPLLLLPHPRIQRGRWLVCWIFMWALCWAAYFHGFHRPDEHEPAVSLVYFLTYVGGAVSSRPMIALGCGTLILFVMTFGLASALRLPERARYAFWIAVMGFAVLNGVTTMLARAHFGPVQAASSRYATFTLEILAASYAMSALLWIRKKDSRLRLAWAIHVGLIAVSVLGGAANSIVHGCRWQASCDYQAMVYLTNETQPDAALAVPAGLRSAEVRRGLAFLRTKQLNIFSPNNPCAQRIRVSAELPALAIPAAGTLFIGQLDGAVRFEGQAFANGGKRLAGGVVLEIDGRRYPAYYGLGPYISPPKSLLTWTTFADFRRDFDHSCFAPGPHNVRLWVLTPDRTACYQPLPAIVFDLSPVASGSQDGGGQPASDK